MDRNIFDTTIRSFRNRRPFQPFTIAMSNGDRLEVDHPDAVIVREGLGVYVGPGRVPVIFDNEGVTHVIGDLAEQPKE